MVVDTTLAMVAVTAGVAKALLAVAEAGGVAVAIPVVQAAALVVAHVSPTPLLPLSVLCVMCDECDQQSGILAAI